VLGTRDDTALFMKITSKKLINLPVETKSGKMLGHLSGFTVETDFQSVSEYYIKPEGLVEGLVKGKLIIARGQVIDISAKKIVVDDNFASGAEKEKNKTKEKVAESALMKELN